MAKNLPANAERHGFDPWSGKIPHASEQLSPCASATEPALLSPGEQLPSPRAAIPEACMPWSLCSATRDATATRSHCTTVKSGPCSPQPEKAHTQQARPSATKRCTDKIKKNFFYCSKILSSLLSWVKALSARLLGGRRESDRALVQSDCKGRLLQRTRRSLRPFWLWHLQVQFSANLAPDWNMTGTCNRLDCDSQTWLNHVSFKDHPFKAVVSVWSQDAGNRAKALKY